MAAKKKIHTFVAMHAGDGRVYTLLVFVRVLHSTTKQNKTKQRLFFLGAHPLNHFHSFSSQARKLSISTAMAALSLSFLPTSPLASNTISFHPSLLARMGRLFTAPSLASGFQFPCHRPSSSPRPCRRLVRAPVTMTSAAPLISPHDHWGIWSAVLSIATFGMW